MTRTFDPTGSPSQRGFVAFVALCAIAVAIYLPGLNGAFVFDDSSFLVTNAKVHVTSLRLGDWYLAATSFPSGAHQGRWLGMLSFAANHYLAGLDPFWMKLTNLGIHAVNGLLIFLLLRALFALVRECQPAARDRDFDPGVAAAAIAGLWLVLPINLTAVLYISQRLESLSNLFVFLGLWLYLRARIDRWRGERGTLPLWTILVVCTAVGTMVKESAIMLPLYAAAVEFAVTGARDRTGRRDRAVLAMYAIMLGAPLLAGSLWLLTWVGGDSSYARPFNTIERVLTEARVIVDYIRWTLLPQPEALTLYHDDVVVSRGLLTPATTLAALLALLTLLGAAIALRARRPLFALGVLWFFCGHLLTGTVIPLMLVMEHRNYFPSIGLLLAGSSLIGLESRWARARASIAVTACLFAFYAFTTWMRAEEWSNPIRLALSEASKRPDSSAAQYELGRTLLYSRREGEETPMTDQGFEVLERASRIPNSDILHEQLLIVGHAQLGRPIDPRWWDSLIAKLNARPPTTADIGGIDALFLCQVQSVCPRDFDRLRLAFDAALKWPSSDGVLLSLHGAFAQHVLNDPTLAEREYRAALQRAPGEPLTHANLIRLLVAEGKTEDARSELAALRALSRFGSLDAQIAELEKLLQDRRTSSGANVGDTSSQATPPPRP